MKKSHFSIYFWFFNIFTLPFAVGNGCCQAADPLWPLPRRASPLPHGQLITWHLAFLRGTDPRERRESEGGRAKWRAQSWWLNLRSAFYHWCVFRSLEMGQLHARRGLHRSLTSRSQGPRAIRTAPTTSASLLWIYKPRNVRLYSYTWSFPPETHDLISGNGVCCAAGTSLNVFQLPFPSAARRASLELVSLI